MRIWLSKLQALFLKHEWLRGYALLSPTLSVMVVALALPIFALVIYSFWTQNYVDIDQTFTLKNYQTFYRDGPGCISTHLPLCYIMYTYIKRLAPELTNCYEINQTLASE